MNIDKIHYISQAPAGSSHLEAMEKVLQSGGRWIQLRVKDAEEADVLAIAMEASLLCKAFEAKLIINDSPRVALRCNAYGVHLGLDDMPVKEARAILGTGKCIGGTANTFEDIIKRAEEKVDYIGLGPYRFTATKKNLSPVLGLDGYIKIMQQMKEAKIEIPVIAIGGIVLPDIGLIKNTGIYGVALSGLLTFNDFKKDFYVNYSR